jgi:hypothetical protein
VVRIMVSQSQSQSQSSDPIAVPGPGLPAAEGSPKGVPRAVGARVGWLARFVAANLRGCHRLGRVPPRRVTIR